MNSKININPSSTKWLEKDDRVAADYFISCAKLYYEVR